MFSIFQSLDSDPCFTRFRKKFKPIDMVAVPDSPYCLIIQVAHQDKNFQVDFGFLKTKFSLLVFLLILFTCPLCNVQNFSPVRLDTDDSSKVLVLSRLIDHICIPGIELELACK